MSHLVISGHFQWCLFGWFDVCCCLHNNLGHKPIIKRGNIASTATLQRLLSPIGHWNEEDRDETIFYFSTFCFVFLFARNTPNANAFSITRYKCTTASIAGIPRLVPCNWHAAVSQKMSWHHHLTMRSAMSLPMNHLSTWFQSLTRPTAQSFRSHHAGIHSINKRDRNEESADQFFLLKSDSYSTHAEFTPGTDGMDMTLDCAPGRGQ